MNERDLPSEQLEPDPARDASGYLLHRPIARPFDPVLKRLHGEPEQEAVLPPDPKTPEDQAQIQAGRENPPPRHQPVTDRSLGVVGQEDGDPYEIFEVAPESELGEGERLLDAELKSDLFIGIQSGPSYPIVDLRALGGAGGAPSFDVLMPVGAELPDDLQETVRDWLAIHAERLAAEEHARRGEATETDIVDIATLEAEQQERRRVQSREAQRRWRKKHAQASHRRKQQWRQKPEVKQREAAYSRAYRKRRKQQPESVVG